MNIQIDREYLLESFRRVVETPSPVGYYTKLNPVLEAMAAELGLSVTYDHRSTAYITLEGEDRVEAFGKEERRGIGLSAILSALGLKK